MDFLSASFKIGRLFGINVRIHILFLIFIAWRLIAWHSDIGIAAMFLAMLFGTVLVHEFGHCFGARAVGGYAQNILMWPLGGLAYAHAPMRPWPQFVTVAAGPLVNVIFCLVSGAIVLGYTRSWELILLNPFGGIYLTPGFSWIECTWIFYQVNLFLLAFNLLPIYPLDGGQLFQTALWPYVGLQRATVIACQIGLAGCVLLGIWGIAREGTSMLVFIAVFGGFTCFQRLQMARYGMLQEDSRYEVFHGPSHDPRPMWRRILGLKHKSSPASSKLKDYGYGPQENPNPGAWEQKQQEQLWDDTELDRLLQKVSEHGINALSYVERQKLERITRERQNTDR